MADRSLTPHPGPESSTSVVDIWNLENPRAVLNLIPSEIQAQALTALGKRPDLFDLEERVLYKNLRGCSMLPTPTDNRLRLNFWFEYELAQVDGRRMRMAAVAAGVCDRRMFDNILKVPEKVAWIMNPPASYMVKINEALDFGIARLRDYLELDPDSVPPAQKLRLMEYQAKIVVMLDQRKHGAYTQKVENKNMNLHLATTDKQVAKAILGNNIEAIEKRLRELDVAERRAQHLLDKVTVDFLPTTSTPQVLPKEDDGE